MGERAVRTRQAGRRKKTRAAWRAQAYLPNRLLHPSVHETRPLPVHTAVRHFFWSERGLHHWFSRITKHETRNTASLVPRGTEALQSCFFRPGLLGKSTRRRRETVPAGRESGLPQALASRKSLILRFLRDTKHGWIHESRDTKHEARFCVFHESRNTSHETRLFSWSLWCTLVLKPFSLFFPHRPA